MSLLEANESVSSKLDKTKEIIEKNGLPDAQFSEEVVIGAVLLGYAEFHAIPLEPDQFCVEKHRRVWQGLSELDTKGSGCSATHLAKHLEEKKQLGSIGGLSYLIDLTMKVPAMLSIDTFVDAIGERSDASKYILKVLEQVDHLILGSELSEARAQISKISGENLVTKRNAHSYGMMTGWQITPNQEDVAKMFAKQPEGIMTGIRVLDEATFGLQKRELVIIGARPSDGKALRNDTPIKTVSGWIEIGNLKVGDQLASIDGQPSQVVGVYPQGVKPMNRITFSDGRSAVCCDEHLWSVYYRNWTPSKTRVVDTVKLKELLTRKRYQTRLSIPVVGGDFGSTETPLPLRPWLLGYLLGNGGLTRLSETSGNAGLTIPDQDTVDRVSNELAFYGCKLSLTTNSNGIDYRIVINGSPFLSERNAPVNPINSILRGMGLAGCGSFEKFVPKEYLDAPRHIRIELIRGLMDSDGTADEKGSPYFCTTSKQLALDCQYLIRSIGGVCAIREKRPFHTYKGERKDGALAYDIGIAVDNSSELFWLERKKDRTRPRARNRRLYIKRIEPCGEAEATCIAVSHPSKLYVINDFIVTHNTALATQICRHAAGSNYRSHIISLEMSKEQLIKRIVCQESNVSYHRTRIGETTPEERKKLAQEYFKTSDLALKISDGVDWTIGGIRNHLKYQQSVDEPIDLLMIDYLGLMPITGHNRRERRDLDLGEITRGLKLLAKEFDCCIVLLSQLSREGEKQNRKPIKSDLKDSGNIEADADTIMMLWHDKAKEESWGRPAEIILEKQRNGPTGNLPVYFMRESTAFKDRDSF